MKCWWNRCFLLGFLKPVVKNLCILLDYLKRQAARHKTSSVLTFKDKYSKFYWCLSHYLPEPKLSHSRIDIFRLVSSMFQILLKLSVRPLWRNEGLEQLDGVSAAGVKHHSPHCSQLEAGGRLVVVGRLCGDWPLNDRAFDSLADLVAAAKHNPILILDWLLLVMKMMFSSSSLSSSSLSSCAPRLKMKMKQTLYSAFLIGPSFHFKNHQIWKPKASGFCLRSRFVRTWTLNRELISVCVLVNWLSVFFEEWGSWLWSQNK